MKTIGLIGGISWESTAEYYRLLNEAVRDRLGGLHSARIVLVSVDFAEVEALQREGRWEQVTRLIAAAARQVEAGGADFFLICTNTIHKMAEEVQAQVSIPLLHIADPTAERVLAMGSSRVGLLGTRFTMEEEFYRRRLADRFGLQVLVPDPAEREVIHRVIFDELVFGEIREESRRQYAAIMARLVERGAEGIILGCTEIGLLVGPQDSPAPLFDTTRLHALAAVEMALAD